MSAALRVEICRLEFRARDPLRFPRVAGNALRGALGMALDAKIFRPPAREGAPSGFHDPPRAFVLRARELNARVFQRGEPFGFDLHVFEEGAAVPVVKALSEAAVKGFGPWRGRAELKDCTRREMILVLPPPAAPVARVRVQFLSPADLKGFTAAGSPPPFDILFGRVRDRVSALFTFYGSELMNVDFKAISERSEAVRLTGGAIEVVHAERHSARTGQQHTLGGFLGDAVYEGELTEFLPWLEAARWTGVGRHTVWGLGEISVEV